MEIIIYSTSMKNDTGSHRKDTTTLLRVKLVQRNFEDCCVIPPIKEQPLKYLQFKNITLKALRSPFNWKHSFIIYTVAIVLVSMILFIWSQSEHKKALTLSAAKRSLELEDDDANGSFLVFGQII